MKPNRTNSFRLQRISRASSLKKHSQTFYHPDDSFKLAAINSVSRGIKYNDPTFLVGDNLHKLRKEPLEEKDQMYQNCHQGLTDTRKKYDDMKKQRVKMDQAIYRLKEDIRKYKIFQKEYNDKIDEAKRKTQNTTKELEAKKSLLEQTHFQKKVLTSMRHRLKSDKVVTDQRKFDLQKQLSFLKKQLQALKRDGMQVSEQGDRATKIQKAFMRELYQQNEERRKHLQNLQAMIDEKSLNNHHNAQRQLQLTEIAQRAMQDKDPNEKEWYNIYMTHLFVSKMLRDKIDREMMKFSTVEMAFKTIKTATGINDTDTLIYKYLNKEVVYGDLLGRITANQQRIQQLKEEQQQLVKEQRDLEMQKDTIQNIKLKTTDITHQLNELQVIQGLRTSVESDKKAMWVWLNKQSRKICAADSARAQQFQIDKKAPQHQKFIQFLKHLSALADICEKDVSQDVTQAGDLTARDSARVTRVMLKKQRKNSLNEDSDEQKLPKNANEEEQQIIDNQRDDILINNQKFMRQARKRMQEYRKILIEKDKGKEKEKKPQVKKDED